MNHFESIKDLINTLAWAKDLLIAMFEKRRFFSYKYEHALTFFSDEDRLETLCSKGVLHKNGAYLELDEQFRDFFEQVLEVNEDINTAYINENIQQVKQNINFYLQENNEQRKNSYQKQVKAALRKIGRITLRNVIDLNRNIENEFKTEPTYSIKIKKLELLDEKRRAMYSLIEQTEGLVTDGEITFFSTALDEELKQIVVELRGQLTESRHNLIETQKQIIEYLHQVKHQSRLLEKIKQIKYLKDQFEIKPKTNLLHLLASKNAVLFEARPAYPLKLSLELLQKDEGRAMVKKVAARLKQYKKNLLPVAEGIASHDLLPGTDEEVFIDLDEIKRGFMASGDHLHSYLGKYNYPREVVYEERITIFCQMVSIYEKDFNIKEVFQREGQVEYAMVLPL